MSNSSSISAFARALLHECQISGDNPLHGKIEISWESKFLQNGLKYVAVQIQCGALCGWLIEALEGAEELQQKAMAVQGMLQGNDQQSQMTLSEILSKVFPEFIIENKHIVP